MRINDVSSNGYYPVSIIDKICIFLLAICPILQHYKGLFVNAAVTVLLFVVLLALVKVYKKRYLGVRCIKFVFPLVLFFFFKVIDHGTTVTEFGQAVVFSILVITIANGCFNTKYFLNIITIVSVIACICIIIQYICYYFFNFHFQMVPTSLLLPKSSQWILGAETGRASITGRISRFYRPSAFFLEPSHMFIYMFTPLTLLLLSEKFTQRERNLSILLSFGMVLSTSGMGILTVVGLWIVFLGRRGGKFSLSKLFRPKTVLIILFFLSGIIIMYLKVSFFQNSIMRIFGSGQDYTNAISGRVNAGNNLIRHIKGVQFLIGVEDGLTGIKFNMSGFNTTMYKYGVIGVTFSYIFYLQGIIKLKGIYFWLSIIIIFLSFFSAHTHSTMFMIYSTFVYTDAYRKMMDGKKE